MRILTPRSLLLLLACPAIAFAWPARTADEQKDPKELLPEGRASGGDAYDSTSALAQSIDGSFLFELEGTPLDEMLASTGLWDEEWSEEAIEETDDEERSTGIPVGSHSNGRLRNGAQFPDDDARFHVIAPWRAYTCQRTVDGLRDAVDQVEALFPGTPALTVGDVSRKGGGPMSPHMSHQIGLDVDIGPYWADGETQPVLSAMHPDRMDMDRTWALLEALVSDENVQYIILDYRLQQAFYEYASELPWMDEAYLELIFQYPRGPKHHEGIIRHWYGHYSHFHVRFFKPEDEI
jgi:hypothetical protein